MGERHATLHVLPSSAEPREEHGSPAGEECLAAAGHAFTPVTRPRPRTAPRVSPIRPGRVHVRNPLQRRSPC
ncbi:hypothetical protein [Streptomyces sp. NPDC020298]|uniref:hypothetical protein n=1 Tax=unclassified Streptomyces TaxID=2593676 RepID=UPI0033E888C6